jgi:hypothetical protein
MVQKRGQGVSGPGKADEAGFEMGRARSVSSDRPVESVLSPVGLERPNVS